MVINITSLTSSRQGIYLAVIAGLILGILFSFFDDIFIPMLLPFVFTVISMTILKNEPRIRKIILIALWLRVFLAVLYHFYLSSKVYIGHNFFPGFLFGADGELYSGHAWWISLLLTGKDIAKYNFIGRGGFLYDLYVLDSYISKGMLVPMGNYQIGFITYLYAVIYSAFGYYPLMINFINCILGVLIGYINYLIALKIFGRKSAYITLIITLFFPSLFIWSTFTKLKDTLYIFSLILFLYLLIKFITKKRPYQVLPILFLVPLIELIRKRTMPLLMLIFVISLLFTIIIRSRRKITVILIVIGFISLIKFKGPNILTMSRIRASADEAISYHRGSAFSGGVVYKLRSDMYDVTKFKLSDYIIFYSKGLFHFFFEPLPTHILSNSILIFYPQQIVWDFAMLFVLLGIVFSIKNRKLESGYILIYLFVMSSGFALAGANIGTLVRHRDVITPVVIIFSSVGITSLFKNEGNPYLSSSFKR